jgi:hypothetical protein
MKGILFLSMTPSSLIGVYRYSEPHLQCREARAPLVSCWMLGLLCNPKVEVAWIPPKRKTEAKLRGLSPLAKYTDRATAACRRS